MEYGHRTHKADGTQGWVPGKFMLTMSVSELEKMKNGLLEKYLADYLKELFD